MNGIAGEENDKAGEENAKKETRRVRDRRVRIASIIIGAVIPAILLVPMIVFIYIDNTVSAELVIAMGIFIITGASIASVYYIKTRLVGSETKRSQLKLAILALFIDLSSAGFLFLGFAMLFIPILGFVFLMLVIVAPMAGIVVGILALNFEKSQKSILGTIIAITAIELPVLAVIVLIILPISGVSIISLM